MVKIKLVHCGRYATLDRVFVKDRVYPVSEEVAETLLAAINPVNGLHFFCKEGEKADELPEAKAEVKVTVAEKPVNLVKVEPQGKAPVAPRPTPPSAKDGKDTRTPAQKRADTLAAKKASAEAGTTKNSIPVG